MKLSTSDYKKILKFYKVSIPKKSKNIKKKADKIIAKKFCSCIKKVQQKFKKEGIAIGICTKSVITRKGYKRGKFRCKKRRTVKLQKGGGKRRKRTRKKRGGLPTIKDIKYDSAWVKRDTMERWIISVPYHGAEYEEGGYIVLVRDPKYDPNDTTYKYRNSTEFFKNFAKARDGWEGGRKKKTRKKRGGWKLIELNVNDLNQEAIGGDFSFTKKGYPHVFDGRLTAYNTNVASFRLTDPPGTLNVNINTIDKIWKYEAEFDTDKNILEFISGRRRGGRRKKKTRKKRGGTANLCKLFHERNLTTTTIPDDERRVLDKYCKDHGDTNVAPDDANKCEITTGNCWFPTNLAPRRAIRSNRQGNNQAMTTQLNQSFSSTHGGAGKRKYHEGSQDNPSSSRQTVALKESAKRRKLAQVVLTKWAELQNKWNIINTNPDNYREEDFDILDYEYEKLFDKVKELEEKYRELAKKHKPGTPAYQNTIGLVDENRDAMDIISRRRSLLRLFINFSVEADRQEGGKRRRKRGGMDNNKTKKSRNRLRRALGKIKVIKEDFVNAKESSPFPNLGINIPNDFDPRVSPITIPITSPLTTPVTSPLTTMDNLIDSMKNTKVTSGGKRVEECGICHEEIRDKHQFCANNHYFCLKCITKWLSVGPNTYLGSCPLCREPYGRGYGRWSYKELDHDIHHDVGTPMYKDVTGECCSECKKTCWGKATCGDAMCHPCIKKNNLIVGKEQEKIKCKKHMEGGRRKKKTRRKRKKKRKKTRRKKGSCKFDCFVKKKTLGEETKATLQKHRAFNEQPKHIKAEIEKTQTLRKGYDNYKHFDNMRMETGNTKLTRRSPSPTWDSTTKGHEEWEPLLEFENKLVNLGKQGKGGKRRKKRR
jgi:hypothetical protein